MLGKLLKYDIKRIGKNMIPFYIILLGLSAVVRLTELVQHTFPILKTIHGLTLFMFIVMLVALFFYTFVVTIKNYYATLVKDEGYLTHTLPVKKTTILNSKLITSMIYFFISLIVFIVSLVIAFYTKDNFQGIMNFYHTITTELGEVANILIVGFSITMVLGYFSYTLLVFLSLAIGQLKNENRIVFSVLAGIVVYAICQAISSMFLLLIGLLDPSIITALNQDIISTSMFIKVFSLSGILGIFYIIMYYLGTNYILEKKLNLE